MKTYSPKVSTIARKWHLFDARNQVLGRLSTQIAKILMGKDRTDFSRHLDMGDHVVIINAAEIVVTGRKEKQKLYHRHSGYPGGMVVTTLSQVRSAHPERILIHAITGMLPDNKIKAKMLTHLHVFAGSDHPYGKQFKNPNS